jgi:transcriptional repressor of dcmA and dcmR
MSTSRQGDTSELLDIREAAELLRVSETSLRRWTNAGRLPCLRIGGRRERRFRRADLLAFMGVEGRAASTPQRNHFCALYTSDLGLVRGATAFLRVGLRSDVRCLLAAEKDVQRAVITQLEQDWPSIRSYLRAGRFVVAECHASTAEQLEYWRAQMRAVLRARVSHAYVVGDVSGGALSQLPFGEILEFEAEYGRSIAQVFPVTTLCLYDARKISGLDAAGVLQWHDGPLH